MDPHHGLPRRGCLRRLLAVVPALNPPFLLALALALALAVTWSLVLARAIDSLPVFAVTQLLCGIGLRAVSNHVAYRWNAWRAGRPPLPVDHG